MKKILSIIGCIIVIAASSCTKKYITPNPNQTILLNVKSNTWTTTDGGKTYSSVINTPEIDSYFNDHGGVLVYFSFTSGVYEQIPEVYQGISFSYTHNPGSLALYAQASDGVTVIQPPADAVVKLLLIDSN
ncbi:hypothetical protein [Mucilaginibacter sp.]|uniref:hypothetical protein n=1 Tax=Mucilaginibacter sp. TaxID=1882438 RepID=UPI003D0CC95F